MPKLKDNSVPARHWNVCPNSLGGIHAGLKMTYLKNVDSPVDVGVDLIAWGLNRNEVLYVVAEVDGKLTRFKLLMSNKHPYCSVHNTICRLKKYLPQLNM